VVNAAGTNKQQRDNGSGHVSKPHKGEVAGQIHRQSGMLHGCRFMHAACRHDTTRQRKLMQLPAPAGDTIA
jgi:hypothetical protein